MITIIHGNDTNASRNLFFEEKNNAKNSFFLDGEGLTFDKLFQIVENKSMFNEEIVIFIENFLTKNKSNTIEFKQIAKYLQGAKASLFLWENSEILKTALSQFPKAEVKNFSLPKNLFLFLDNIKPGNKSFLIKLFHELKESSETEIIFFMMIRQFRLLIASLDNISSIDEVKRLAPWQLSKFKTQLSFFDKSLLLKSYALLFEIDLNHKTGKVSFSMDKSIDFFLAGL